ncbi:UDP-3-O-(3-hydroxymyristoyl)glucosamine N-acyltransferase [Alphaproteobacteria bacterium]|nr:UDP-3-O-(3-hydroxymyristoyl)glucosamine N-acyltransferase [Alphaproteobacteria bacterium]
MGSVKASDIATFLNADLLGQDFDISAVSSLTNPKHKTLVFSKKAFVYNGKNTLLVICSKETLEQGDIQTGLSFIVVSNPRLAFGKVVQHFFIEKPMPFIHPSAVVSENSEIHPSVSIGAYCIIESGVSIGGGTIIKNHVVISENVKIGKSCLIKSGAVIGEEGFAFEYNEAKTPVKIPHVGSVSIGDFVEIGSNSVIARGTIDNTQISDNVKIDDQVFIAHNVNINRSVLLCACAQVSGSVEISENVWVGPNSSIIQKTKVGSGSLIGIGSVVTEDVEPGQKIMGFRGFPLRKLLSFMKILQRN